MSRFYGGGLLAPSTNEYSQQPVGSMSLQDQFGPHANLQMPPPVMQHSLSSHSLGLPEQQQIIRSRSSSASHSRASSNHSSPARSPVRMRVPGVMDDVAQPPPPPPLPPLPWSDDGRAILPPPPPLNYGAPLAIPMLQQRLQEISLGGAGPTNAQQQQQQQGGGGVSSSSSTLSAAETPLNRSQQPQPQPQPQPQAHLSYSTIGRLPSDSYLAHEDAMRIEFDASTSGWIRTPTVIRMAPEPFARGSMRLAFHLLEYSAHDLAAPPRVLVAKFLDKQALEAHHLPADPSMYFSDVELQLAASFFADLYNSHSPPKTVSFLPAWVLELSFRPGQPLCFVEPYLPGEYLKHNNNLGDVCSQRNTPQAFSHFTYEVSDHERVVCDIQGVGDTYTDPQVHSRDGNGYGLGNLGSKGIADFLNSHTCNPCCALLSLPHMIKGVYAAPPSSDPANAQEQQQQQQQAVQPHPTPLPQQQQQQQYPLPPQQQPQQQQQQYPPSHPAYDARYHHVPPKTPGGGMEALRQRMRDEQCFPWEVATLDVDLRQPDRLRPMHSPSHLDAWHSNIDWTRDRIPSLEKAVGGWTRRSSKGIEEAAEFRQYAADNFGARWT